ncbi:MAG: aminoacyl-tRNA hydrolase [Armatimonadetes bacterium]|nr:aminoacyl-tRNA hydrolase [Armatimonadota bacterium]
MVMIVGLGNPGARYEATRHNVGYAVVDELASRHGVAVRTRAHRALIGQGRVGDSPVMLVKPATYMNLSGEAVGSLSRYHRVDAGFVWVVVDDVALPVGALRLRLQGSAGGHHGLESIEAHLGTRAYPRVRIGIGGASATDLIGHVLARFSRSESVAIAEAVALAADALETALSQGFETAMNRYNRSPAKAEEGKAEEG